MKAITVIKRLQILEDFDLVIYLSDHLNAFQSFLSNELHIQFFRKQSRHHIKYLYSSMSMFSMLEQYLMQCFHCLSFLITFDKGELLLMIVLILKQTDFPIFSNRLNL